MGLCDTIMTDVRVILGPLSDFLCDGSVSCIPSSSSASYSGWSFPIFHIYLPTQERRGEEIILVENEISKQKDSPSVTVDTPPQVLISPPPWGCLLPPGLA